MRRRYGRPAGGARSAEKRIALDDVGRNPYRGGTGSVIRDPSSRCSSQMWGLAQRVDPDESEMRIISTKGWSS
ncbi:MAG: hypothetical protein DI639_14250 [Leifsonia xyli]|jgi:hypothetical protein|nr:MAG: hypothetical protein DI639_14250 [Leifsonia xyli]